MKKKTEKTSNEKEIKERLVLALSGGEKESYVRRAVKKVGWVELRLDSFMRDNAVIPWKSLQDEGVRIIGTVRWKKESQGKGWDITEKQRLEIYREIMDYVDFVDVEIKSPISGDVIAYARKKEKRVILSYHDFKKTPGIEILEGICAEASEKKPDIIKVAVNVSSEDELFELIVFTYNNAKKIPLVVAPMGVSPVERLIPVYFGSLFTYVSLDERHKTAPGQVSIKDALKLLH